MNQSNIPPQRKPLGVFALAMINVIAVDSLRSITAGAEYGFALLFFYALTGLLFFLPTILVTSELSTSFPTTGGVYIWVREAFGKRLAFFTIWLQWIYNVVWYPTIFAFIASTITYLIDPALANNKLYMVSTTLATFWLGTLFACSGFKTSKWLNAAGGIIGTLLPMILISLLGLGWLFLGKPTALNISWNGFIPDLSLSNLGNLAFLTNLLFGLLGIEMSAVHAGDVANPRRDYPRALAYSGVLILLTLTLSSFAVAVVIPPEKLNLVSGVMNAFSIFFTAYNLGWLVPIMAILIILGALSGASAWILGPARALLVSSEDIKLPRLLTYTNRADMPVGILLAQGVIVSLLCLVFVLMPTVNSSYWILSNLTAQLALIFYVIFFITAIKLRNSKKSAPNSYRVPGGKTGLSLICIMGALTAIVTIFLGFLPPSQLPVGKIIHYEMFLIGGLLVFCGLPFMITYLMRRKKTILVAT